MPKLYCSTRGNCRFGSIRKATFDPGAKALILENVNGGATNAGVGTGGGLSIKPVRPKLYCSTRGNCRFGSIRKATFDPGAKALILENVNGGATNAGVGTGGGLS